METQTSTATAPAASPEVIAANAAIDGDTAANKDEAEGAEGGEGKESKPEKTAEERRIEQMQRGIDRQTKKYYRERAAREAAEARISELLTNGKKGALNDGESDDSETLSLTRKQFDEQVQREATKLARTLKDQQSELEQKTSVAQSLLKSWGKEKFDKLASDLDDAFDGLVDGTGKPKAATDAVFQSDNPARVIEYLSDPDNIDEAERIAGLNPIQAGKAIAKLDIKLAADDAAAKPKESKVPAPLEPAKGRGAATKALAGLSGDDFDKRRREMIKNRR